MADLEMPPANLILQALNAIRGELKAMQSLQQQTNERLDTTVERLDTTVERLARVEDRLERLEKRTTKGFLETNTRLAALARVVAEHDRRLDHLLIGGLGQEVRDLKRRVDRLESARLARLPPKKRS